LRSKRRCIRKYWKKPYNVQDHFVGELASASASAAFFENRLLPAAPNELQRIEGSLFGGVSEYGLYMIHPAGVPKPTRGN
jgi:hypothetical protein